MISAPPEAAEGGRSIALLALCGAALMLTQYLAVREIGAAFASTELVLFASTLVVLLGPSLAYALADRLPSWALLVWGALSMGAHLLLPLGLRALVGIATASGLEAYALWLTFALGGLLLSGFFAVFLPRIAREPGRLSTLYAIELLGALAGLGLLALLPHRLLILAHWGIGLSVIHLGLRRRALSVSLALLALPLAIFFPDLEARSSELYFWGYHGLENPIVVESAHSPFQRIDVVDSEGERLLFLDGLLFFADEDEAFNEMMAGVPGRLLPPGSRTLVVGSGSFGCASRLHRRGHQVQILELDAEVARLGLAHFAHVHGLGSDEIPIEYGDLRRHVERLRAGSLDLIVLDLPAPHHLRTALLHTPALYARLLTRLSEHGLVAISLSDTLDGTVGGAVAASALEAFPEALAIEDQGLGIGYLYGGRSLPFGAAALEREARAGGVAPSPALGDRALRERVRGRAPLSASNLIAVLQMAREQIPEPL